MAILTPSQRDRVLPRLIEDEMRESFIDYSMSVIVQRALPDVRDGLKPVHRRILYAMQEAGLTPARPYKKSAAVVGDVLGKYHPHGDSAVYDAMVRMVQEFSLRYPLVDGQGNFGSIDGDSAAAYRYTEARLSAVATEMLADIEKETVDFAPNFDDRLTEPRVLPARLPNLLVNGSSGIAVGMSTNVPPHNLSEVVRAAVHLLDHPECTVEELMVHLPGPDFPTGGIIVGVQGIRDAYTKGRGRVVMRARVYREQQRSGRERLVVTEIPYGTNKSRITEQIAELARAGRLTDLSDLRDESDRDGIRLVIELKRGGDPAKVLAALYKGTALQSTFGVIALALDGGVPREFTLKEILERFRDHRVQVVVRRSRWELERARDEAHVLAGLVRALSRIDEVVAIIRSSRNRDTAARKLEEALKLTTRQSEAILAMRLSRLTQLETRELKERMKALELRISELEALLASPEAQLRVVRDELTELAERYGDPRRTTIFESEKAVRLEDMLAIEEVVVTVTAEGFVKQVPMAVYQRAAGTGRSLVGGAYDGDHLERVMVASSDAWLMAFTAAGRAHAISVRDLPDPGLSSRGKRLQQLLELPKGTGLASVQLVGEFPAERAFLFATAGGTVKRTPLDQFARPRAGGVEAISLRDGDRLVAVAATDGEAEVVLGSSGGRAIRFPEAEIPPMGRATQGVRGIRLGTKERLVGLVAGRAEDVLCTVTPSGAAKCFALDELPLQKRDGKGVSVVPAGGIIALLALPATDLAAVLETGAVHRLRRAEIPVLPRDAEPAELVATRRGARVARVTALGERDAAASGGGGTSSPPEDGGDAGEESDGASELPIELEAAHADRDAPVEPVTEAVPTAAEAVHEEPSPGDPPGTDELDLFG
jgi:DNA gyrase subunit A